MEKQRFHANGNFFFVCVGKYLLPPLLKKIVRLPCKVALLLEVFLRGGSMCNHQGHNNKRAGVCVHKRDGFVLLGAV